MEKTQSKYPSFAVNLGVFFGEFLYSIGCSLVMLLLNIVSTIPFAIMQFPQYLKEWRNDDYDENHKVKSILKLLALPWVTIAEIFWVTPSWMPIFIKLPFKHLVDRTRTSEYT